MLPQVRAQCCVFVQGEATQHQLHILTKIGEAAFNYRPFFGLLLLLLFFFFLKPPKATLFHFFFFPPSLGPEPPARGGGRGPGAKKVERRITALAQERKRHPKRAASSACDLRAIITGPARFARRFASSPVGICKLTEQHCFSRPALSACV